MSDLRRLAEEELATNRANPNVIGDSFVFTGRRGLNRNGYYVCNSCPKLFQTIMQKHEHEKWYHQNP